MKWLQPRKPGIFEVELLVTNNESVDKDKPDFQCRPESMTLKYFWIK